MRLIAILFILVTWTIVKGMILEDTSGTPVLVFPTFDTPDFEFIDLSGGCGGFTDCIEYVGAVIYNIGLGLIFLILFLVELLSYIFELLVLIFTIQFTGISGAPGWLNIILALPIVGALAIIVYTMARKGNTSA
jgi:hypothetical protein